MLNSTESLTTPANATVASDTLTKDAYARFTPVGRAIVVLTMGLGVIAASLGNASLLPAIPLMAVDLHTTQEVVNYALAVYHVMLGVAPLFLGPLATYYGRPPILALSALLFAGGSIGMALSRTVSQIFGFMILQGSGSTTLLSLGSTAVADCFPPEKRGRGLAFFFSLGAFGSAVSPAISGLLVEYTEPAWRSSCWLLAALAVTVAVLQIFVVPDTAHNPSPHAMEKAARKRGFIVKFPNPIDSLRCLRYHDVLLLSLYMSFTQFGAYTIIVPLTYTMAPRYGITNAAIIGSLFLAAGGGNILGGFVGGKLSDWSMIRYAQRFNRKAPAEDRLRLVWIGGVVLFPASLIAGGWLMHTGAGGIAPALIALFVSGVASMLVLVPGNTYLIDCAKRQKEDASNNVMSAALAIRFLFTGSSSAGVIPMIDATNVGWTNTFAAGLDLVAYPLVLLAIYWHLAPDWMKRNSRSRPESTLDLTKESGRLSPEV